MCFPSVRTLNIDHRAARPGPYAGWAIPPDALDRLAAMFPRVQRLSLTLSELFVDELGAFPAAPPSDATKAVLGNLQEFEAQYCAASWSLLQHVPLPKIPFVRLQHQRLDTDTLGACIPADGHYRVDVAIYGDMAGSVELCAPDGTVKRTLVADMDAIYSSQSLFTLVTQMSWRIVSLSVTIIAWEALLAVAPFGFPNLMALRLDIPDPYWHVYDVWRPAKDMSHLVMQSLCLLVVQRTPAKDGFACQRRELQAYLADLEFDPAQVTLALLGMTLEDYVPVEETTTFLREVRFGRYMLPQCASFPCPRRRLVFGQHSIARRPSLARFLRAKDRTDVLRRLRLFVRGYLQAACLNYAS